MTWTFRPLTRADFPLLASWLSDPDVRRWWQHDPSPEAVERDFGPTVDRLEPGEDLVAELDGRPVGLVQRARVHSHPEDRSVLERIVGPVDPSAVQLDYLVGAVQDRGIGLGPRMLEAIVAETFADPDVPYVLVAVVAANRRSWRALERAGFHRVGSGEAEPDNPVDDPLHHVLRRDQPSRDDAAQHRPRHDGSMLIVVTGASGRTGTHVVTALLAAGHTVRAVVRTEEKGAALREQGAEVVLADLTTDDPAPWLAEADALIHTAAASDPTPGASDAVDRDATLALVAGAEQAGVQRMIQVSSMYADRPEEGPDFLHDVLRAKAVSDQALRDSALMWTIVRPGGLIDDEPTGLVAAGRHLDSGRISRADVAHVCVACLAEPVAERLAFDLTSGDLPIGEALADLRD